ncbi:hypothetical protein A2154_02980 [Candidatus Gottesmanbacteria bacterium RBG_16_43_7]|uniref:P-type ATPase A domain-containing protein n=1 Tax=Candidatus Gottesmanbacteria bacterium RBG_16_43_7 TaxID=1798373 RepID=A0A1F5Z9X9_9BACT|nr:MAG: hypothetical protein A2154_02980 [Candidatus Gottesmanbacteria bacterium RBG_16_43_7]
MEHKAFLNSPTREYIIIAVVTVTLGSAWIIPQLNPILLLITVLVAIPTVVDGVKALLGHKITIETFNSAALLIALFSGETTSAAVIVLMLSLAQVLEIKTQVRAQRAVAELMKLKPQTAKTEVNGIVSESPIIAIKVGDILVVENGERIPADGEIIYGKAYIDESSVTGESKPVYKTVSSRVVSGTLNQSGLIKVKAISVGADSTIEQMARLISEAERNKSRSEKLADKFSGIFLPVLLIIGAVTYLVTRNASMTAALFLVACADDMAVAIPLTMTIALGRAARRGVIIKGGMWLDAIRKIKTLVLDKTGTLTYGAFTVKSVYIEPSVSTTDFWKMVAIAEKYSEHPAGKALFSEANKFVSQVPDAESVDVYGGSGLVVRFENREIIIGEYSTLLEQGLDLGIQTGQKIQTLAEDGSKSRVLVVVDKKFYGTVDIADVPRIEAKDVLTQVKKMGVAKTVMFTGDREDVASSIARGLGIDEYESSMRPEEKLDRLEKYLKDGKVAMVGDGVNDAPALARADVGIAMGIRGTPVAVETADIVILTDDLNRIPEMMLLGRQTFSVIRWDIILWVLSNAVGFGLVFTGIVGPVLAATYNFLTDFLPIANSIRLYKKR